MCKVKVDYNVTRVTLNCHNCPTFVQTFVVIVVVISGAESGMADTPAAMPI